MSLAITLGKVRNFVIVIISAFVVMCLLKYLQWCIYIPLVFSARYNINEPALTFFNLLNKPDLVFEMAKIINENGVWSLNKIGRSSTGIINGFLLMIFWIMEFIIMTECAFKVFWEDTELPFSEILNSWYIILLDKVIVGVPFDLSFLKKKIEHSNFNKLTQDINENKKNKYIYLSIYQPSEASTEPFYLSIKNAKRKILLKNLKIDQTDVENILKTIQNVNSGA